MAEVSALSPPPETDRIWYSKNLEIHTAFTKLVHVTVENLIRARKIDLLAVTSRTKSIDSFLEKIGRKRYESHGHVTDLCGICVVTYIESDALAVAELLRRSFNVHPEKSLDKSEEPGDSQMGYRSIHLICELSGDRAALPEYKPFEGLLFEIQVRTILQHAWAQIEHDRGYKFSGALPLELRRRLNVVAAQLEAADKEFVRLAGAIDVHIKDVETKAASGNLNIELSSQSIAAFMSKVVGSIVPKIFPSEPSRLEQVIDELDIFGVKSIADLQTLFSLDFLRGFNEAAEATTDVGILRRGMMYKDIDKYFEKAWRFAWRGFAKGSRALLKEKWKSEKIRAIEEKYFQRQRKP